MSNVGQYVAVSTSARVLVGSRRNVRGMISSTPHRMHKILDSVLTESFKGLRGFENFEWGEHFSANCEASHNISLKA